MSIIQRIMDWVRPAQPMNTAFEESFWREALAATGVRTQAGEHVNWQSAMRLTTALRCALVLADGVATVPCKIMRKDPTTGRRTQATDHPLHNVLGRQSNDWMDSLQLRETLMLHTVFTGNAYCFIGRSRGRIVDLIPLDPKSVTPEQDDEDYTLTYKVVGKNGSVQEFPASTIWHIRGPSWNGYQGLDVTTQAAEALGLAAATQRAHSKRFADGIQTTGALSVEGQLDDAQYKRLNAWVAKHTGPRNSGKPLVLDNGAKWTPMELTGVDAQHIETRKLQIEEICRAYGVNPIMVYHFDRNATYASSEQMFLQHLVHTIRPWHRRLEASMHRALLTKEEFAAGYYVKFVDTEMLRGAAKDRAEYYYKMFQMGVSPNTIVGFEDMDGFEGGDEHFIPANMINVKNANDPKAGHNGGPALQTGE